MYNLLLRVKCYLLLSIKTIKFENIRWVVANNIILDKTERQTDHSDDGNRIYRFEGNGNEMEELDYVFCARLGDLCNGCCWSWEKGSLFVISVYVCSHW